jgi:peptide-methionine (S)-S-oxide reductase
MKVVPNLPAMREPAVRITFVVVKHVASSRVHVRTFFCIMMFSNIRTLLNRNGAKGMRTLIWNILILPWGILSSAFAGGGVMDSHLEKATLGAGCFWCVEAVFERLDGVVSVEAGYAGGTTPHPTYEEVCTGRTGHAEVAQISFDPKRISFKRLLEVFWAAHDPTTLNRQGADVGTQYRSVIYYENENQRSTAEESKKRAQAAFPDPIVTSIEPLTEFHKAENYHQDYYRNHKDAPYCQIIIKPKLKKLGLE